MIKMKKVNDEIFYADEDVIQVSKEDIDLLKKKALQNPRKRCRLCTHKDVNDKIHEMLIVHTKDVYVRPHKHLNKTETFHIIEGRADVVLFDDKGKIIQVIPMGDYTSKNKFLKFYYRVSQPYYHTLLINSEIIVFHEVTKGPFKKEDTIFPSWAPEDNDKKGIKKFMNKLSTAIKKRGMSR